MILKYHAAKMPSHYLQHLDGDGRKKLQLMWHLRQWPDELRLESNRFANEENEFRDAFEKFQASSKDF